jgi:gas vesicle protein
MAYFKEEESSSTFLWMVTGVAIGAVLGVLYAPKAGSELRESLGDYAGDVSEKAKDLVDQIGDKIPKRVKAAAGFGAIKEGGREAFREIKNRISDRLG